MTRPLDTATKAAFDKPVLPLAMIMYLDIKDDPLYAWTGIGDLYFTGRSYTNKVTNNTFQGALAVGEAGAGTRGTDPTGVPIVGTSLGLEKAIVGRGTTVATDGTQVEYIDVRFWGTPTSGNAAIGLAFGLPTQANQGGKIWSAQAYLALIAGTTANTFGFQFRISGEGGANTLAGLDNQLRLFTNTRTISTGTTANVTFRFAISTAGVPVDFTIRLGLPQLFEGEFLSPVAVKTYGAEATYTEPAETGDPSLDGKTFKGTGILAEISNVSEGVGGSDALEITMPSVDPLQPAMRQLITNRNRWQFRRAIVWMLALDPDTDAIVGKPFRIKTGRMDKMPYNEGRDGASAKVRIEGQQAYGNEPLNTRYSEQFDINPTDYSQNWVHSLANMSPEIGKASAANGFRVGGGINTENFSNGGSSRTSRAVMY